MQANSNMPGQFSAANVSPPGVNPGMPLPSTKSAAEASSLAQPSQAAQVAAPVDPNAAVLRRRRFQNLPQ